MSAVLPHPEITTQRLDWLAEDAVMIGPVSAAKFPASRQFAGNFCRFCPLWAIFMSIDQANPVAYEPNSLRLGAGNFFAVAGKFFEGAGKMELIPQRLIAVPRAATRPVAIGAADRVCESPRTATMVCVISANGGMS